MSHLDPAAVTKEMVSSNVDLHRIFLFLKPPCKANSDLSILTHSVELQRFATLSNEGKT